MQRLEEWRFRLSSLRKSSVRLPPRKELLLFAFVAITVAGCVTFLSLRLQALAGEPETANATNQSTVGEARGLPDVLESRCLDQTPKHL